MPCVFAPQQAFKELNAAYARLNGRDVPRHPWFSGSRDLRAPPAREHCSMFFEFMGVRCVERERTWSHVLRAAFCCRLVPRLR